VEGATEEQKRIMNFAYDTNERMVALIKPGMKGKTLFEETLRICEQAGLAKYFLPYNKRMRAIGHLFASFSLSITNSSNILKALSLVDRLQ
jgi:Xaa-Pro aminopeptidase